MTRYTMKAVAECGGDYPESLLREWAVETLGAERCSATYLSALRIVLGNMARADRHGAQLHLTQAVSCIRGDEPFASRQTMRTILGQLHSAGLVTPNEIAGETVYMYRGTPRIDTPPEDHDPLERLYREAEDAAFLRYRQSVGLCVGDVPY